jgi:prepilin-type N-terminal cleavage/methylation domain-containing protein
MMCNLKRQDRRGGFTLIELLVVIGLTTAAVMRYYVKGPEALCQSEISALSNARSSFLTEFKVAYMPSRIRLRENGAYNMSDLLDRRSAAFLQKMFGPRFNVATARDWNNNGTMNDVLELEGQACLVFFLGGIPTRTDPPGCLGFSTDPTNPVGVDAAGNPLAGVARIRPFFEFRSNRLSRTAPNAANLFVYQDAFGRGMPYAYFSSGRAGNDYANDCPSLLPNGPFRESAARFINADGFQIISAGTDGQFGDPATFSMVVGYNGARPGADDLANFSQRKLGVAPQ